MYKSCENGAVVIRYTSGDDENNGRHARPGGDVIAGISEIALKYRNSVLTILCLPTDCVKIKESFLENLDNVSFVELTEDTVVEKIIVFKAEKIDGHRTQRIQIIYNCIGAVELPSKQEKTA